MTITRTKLELRKVAGRIGAEVRGLHVTPDLDADTVTELTAALHEHKALFFRGVELDDAGQQRFAALFGELTTAHPTVPGRSGEANVLAVDSETGGRANHWHTDVTFVLSPPKITTLRSLVIPSYGGDTLIANTAAAYRDLPEPLRALADSLVAVHTNDYDYARPQLDNEQAKAYREVFVSRKYQTAHPVVRVHPVTGERGLYIGGFAQRVVGLSGTESRDLLRLLLQYVTRPENTVRWQWQAGDLVVFDNRITQHYALDDYDDQPRLLHRVTVAGDVPAGVDGRPSQVIEGDASHYTAVAA
jgi:taurine dioxygenase